MDVGEEVIDQQLECGERANRLGIEDGVRGEGGERRCDIVGRCRRRETSSARRLLQLPLLDSFCVPIWRTATSAGSIEGTWDV